MLHEIATPNLQDVLVRIFVCVWLTRAELLNVDVQSFAIHLLASSHWANCINIINKYTYGST